MNTKELLTKLAGNDHQKQLRAEQWATLIWPIGCELTEAQGKVLLNEACPDEEGGTIYALEHAINLREPVFLKTTVDLLWNTDAMYLCRVLDVLNKDAQRQLLKTPDNFINMLILIDDALQYRNCAEPYELWCPCDDEVDINSVYRAAWYILNAYSSDYAATVTERYSLKKIKSVLKTPERIDRYAQIVHKEYDYSIGYLLAAKELIESLNISEFEPIWFRTSEDIADEGAIMNNCIAGYWHDHGISCCVFACIYKGHRLDIEIAKDKEFFSIKQCLEKGNSATYLADELLCTLDTALQMYRLTSRAAQDPSLLHCKLCRDAMILVDTGEIVIDNCTFLTPPLVYGVNSTDEPVVYKRMWQAYIGDCIHYLLTDITDTKEGREAIKLDQELTAIFEDEDDYFDDHDTAFEPQFLDDYELFD